MPVRSDETWTGKCAHPAGKVKPDSLITKLRDNAAPRINSRVIDERRTSSPSTVLDFVNDELFGLPVLKLYGGLQKRRD